MSTDPQTQLYQKLRAQPKCGNCRNFLVRPPEVQLAQIALPMAMCGPGRYCHGGPVRGTCHLSGQMAESTQVCADHVPGGPSIRGSMVAVAGSANTVAAPSAESASAESMSSGAILALGAVGAVALMGVLFGKIGSGSADRVSNQDVPAYWSMGMPANANGHFKTDGYYLYSYELLIGWTDANGKKVLANYTREGEYVSHTTSRHVGYAMSIADEIVPPGGTRRRSLRGPR